MADDLDLVLVLDWNCHMLNNWYFQLCYLTLYYIYTPLLYPIKKATQGWLFYFLTQSLFLVKRPIDHCHCNQSNQTLAAQSTNEFDQTGGHIN